MFSVMDKNEAMKLVESGDTVVINGFGSLVHPEEFDEALGDRFLKTGEPRDLSFIFAAGQGVWDENRFIDRLSHEGLVKKVISGHWQPMLRLCKLAVENKIEAYNLPMGAIVHLFRASAAKKPGIITKVGLKTFADPRIGGGGLNEISKEELVKVIEIDGEEYLFYKSFKPNVAFIRGTTADPNGNITMEKEVAFLDALSMAQAVKANDGNVIVQVERLSSIPANPKNVKIPGILVDAVVVAPEQKQTIIETYNQTYSGELRVPDNEIKTVVENVKKLNSSGGKKRKLEHLIVARRAARELHSNCVVNLGIGIPEMVAVVADKEKIAENVTFTVESGTIGGVASSGFSFGAAINPDVIYDQAYQFDFYDGGGLDITFVGAMEADKAGNVNVSRLGEKIIGVGGFVDITQCAKKVVYCFTFSNGGLKVEYKDGKLNIIEEGKYLKFTNEVDQISFSGDFARETEQEVIYVTERCVFKLLPEGLTLTEVAPGISIEEDILEKMPFRPIISDNIKTMDISCFGE
ncbi:hypothetical protein SH2C18_51980 [Clostridium sediminicola]|uniref:acyl CoA:acetate/3-ketoacid CoA transferase n=1 Tax=Clostridium sediminicola TaxID=3114879 RepID=UPI0031F26034